MGGRKKKIPDTYFLDKTGTIYDVLFVILASIAEGKTRAALPEMFGLGDEWVTDNIRDIFSILKVPCIETAIDKAWQLGIFTEENRVINPVWKTMSFIVDVKSINKPKED